MASWETFAAAQPELAARGAYLLMVKDPDAAWPAGLAYLATVRADGGPRIHPIGPVLLRGRLYAFVLRNSPKCRDLHRSGLYALHSYPHFPEPMGWETFTDEEFYLTGRATLVPDEVIRAQVATMCGDDVDSGDVFELDLVTVLHKARPDGKLTYTKWRDEA